MSGEVAAGGHASEVGKRNVRVSRVGLVWLEM